MEKRKIGILSIGSGVGQSVIESLLISNRKFITYGLGNNPLAFGATACDYQILIPGYQDPTYIQSLLEVCIQEEIQLLIPGSDDEAHILSHHIQLFKNHRIEIIVSNSSLLDIIRDKFLLATYFNERHDLFVKSETLRMVKERIKDEPSIFPMIAKPKNGYASKGLKVILNEQDLSLVHENDVLQSCLIPASSDPNHQRFLSLLKQHVLPQLSEYSYQIIFDQNSQAVHRMVSINSLNSGVPIEIVPCFDDSIWEPMEDIIQTLSKLGAKGPINVQGRWTDQGFKAFEINARFTGITGLRAQLGFNEVLYCVESWLKLENTAPMQIHRSKVGIRQTSNRSLSRVHPFLKGTRYYNQESVDKPKLLLTGANGYLGYALLSKLSNLFQVIALIREDTALMSLTSNFPAIHFVLLKDIDSINFGHLDIIIHSAFLRPYREEQENYQASIDLTRYLLEKVIHHQIPNFLFISSASINLEEKGLKTAYTVAKYACEAQVNLVKTVHPHLKLQSIRLHTLFGANPFLQPIDMVSKMVMMALHQENIYLQFNKKEERMHINEAADLILHQLNDSVALKSEIFQPTLKVQYTTLAFAQVIQKIASTHYDIHIDINYEGVVVKNVQNLEYDPILESQILELFECLKFSNET